MSNKKKDLARDLARGRSIKKEISTTEADAKKVVQKVAKAEANTSRDERPIRTTMDLPRYIHTAIKVKSATDQISLKDYIVSLVKKDLGLD